MQENGLTNVKVLPQENHITDEKLFKQRRAIAKSSLAFSLLTFSNLLSSDDKKLNFLKI